MSYTCGDLFSGIGGGILGMHRAGFTTPWAVEIDRNCQQVLHRHFPDTQIHADVCTVGKHNLTPVDVIFFGSPCQGLSVAGKREGFADERSGLFYEAIRIIRELQPAFAVWENVPGAFTAHAGRDFGTALHELVQCGARDVAWRVLDAQYFGVPQRRRRVFTVADFRGERAGEILFESEGLPWTTATSSGVEEETAYYDARSTGTDCRSIARCLTTKATQRIDSRTETFVIDKQGKVRRLTPRECERLQGFPDDWTAGQADTVRYRQLGNAICVPVAAWIGQRIHQALIQEVPA